MSGLNDSAASKLIQPAVRRKEVDLGVVWLGFLGLILLGGVLLWLPFTHRPGVQVPFIDALFLSTSAVCVTGLSTVNVAECFNGVGQGILLALIQAGGLGIFTASISMVLLSGNRLSLSDEQTIQATVGKIRNARPADIFIYACIFVGIIELAGAVGLFVLMSPPGEAEGVWTHAWEALFHSVSAFCNAGISIYPEGLIRWRHEPGLLSIITLLVIAGGIGLMTLINLRYFYFWRRDPRRRGRLTLQTRVSIASAVLLLAAGTVATYVFEFNHTHQGQRTSDGILWSFFHSAMCRTAGYNVVDNGQMNPPTLLVSIGLMFIGGSPGSMAGGIKTVTLVVLVMTAWSALKRRNEVQFWKRRLTPEHSAIAVMIALMAVITLTLGVGLLMFLENGRPASQTSQQWLAIVYEAVSAFGTVGLSTGVTPLLTFWGKFVIIALMFVGRVGPLALSVYLSRPARTLLVKHPREELSLG